MRAGVEDTNARALAFSQITGRPAPSRYFVIGSWTRSGGDDLVAWQASGVPPSGDDVAEAALSDVDYGCAFTTETRPGFAACP